MTQEERIREAAGEYAAQYWYNNHQHTGVMNGFIAGALWSGKPENVTDDQIMAVLNAIGYEERSWIEVVRKDITNRKTIAMGRNNQH